MIDMWSGLKKTIATIYGIIFFAILIPCVGIMINTDTTSNPVKIIFVIVLLVLIYWLLILITYWTIHIEKNYMILNADAMIVRSPFINSIEPQTIAYSEIICLEYYTYFSAKSWLMLLTSFVAPQSVFIIYTKNGEKRSSLIGYLERKQIIDIAQKYELTIVMK